MTAVVTDTEAARSLLTAGAVRARANMMLQAGLADRLEHFRIDLAGLERAADLTARGHSAKPIRRSTFRLHSRWRHFVLDGDDRWAALAGLRAMARPRRAGARGIRPRHRQRAARRRRRTGLALPRRRHRPRHRPLRRAGAGEPKLCSRDGLFSAEPRDPLRVDADRLAELTSEALAAGFQAGPRQSARRARRPRRPAAPAGPHRGGGTVRVRPGGSATARRAVRSSGGAAPRTGASPPPRSSPNCCTHLGPIWPSRLHLGGIPLGDCWRHPAITTGDATTGLMPLHKLSQWLSFSLIEPLLRAGIVGDRPRRPDRACGIPQWRPVH